MIARINLIMLFLFLCWTASYSQSSDRLCERIETVNQKFNITIVHTGNVVDSRTSVSYDVCEIESMIRYLDLLIKEYGKYPRGYLTKTGIRTIVLTKNLKLNGQARAAVPDPYKAQLYLSVNGAYGVGSARYLIHVMHHELHHCTEYALWNNMTYDWSDWMLLNVQGFCYGNGGASVYSDAIERNIDVYSPSNPQKGFINLYSLTGDEEDRAELLAYLLTDFERPMLKSLLKKDEILRKKIEALKNLLHKFTGEPILIFQEL